MDSKITRLIEQASVIVGALPYLQAYRDKTFLIKFGGSAMDDARLVKKLMPSSMPARKASISSASLNADFPIFQVPCPRAQTFRWSGKITECSIINIFFLLDRIIPCRTNL